MHKILVQVVICFAAGLYGVGLSSSFHYVWIDTELSLSVATVLNLTLDIIQAPVVTEVSPMAISSSPLHESI